jgi:TraG-like protein, N-terminal region
MGVDSYLELFTTSLGWYYYNQFWNILATTGIVFIPFFGILFDAWREAYVYGAEEGGATRAVRVVEIEVYLAMFVITIAAVPTSFTDLSRLNLTYKPQPTALMPNPPTATVNSGQSTYESAFATIQGGSTGATNTGCARLTGACVPVFWYATMALSSGLVQEMKAKINVDLKDFDGIRMVAANAAINSPDVRAEVQRFFGECYLPVRSKLMAAAPNAPERINPANGNPLNFAVEDWMGSRYFVDHPLLYGDFYAKAPVPGFNVDFNRDKDFQGSPSVPDWGRPTCKQWWENGLLDKVVAESDKAGTPTMMESVRALTSFSTNERKDIVARALLSRNSESVLPGSYYGTNGGTSDLIANPAGTVRDGLALSGLVFGGAAFTVFQANVIATLPILQPLILFSIYMLLPFILVLGRFQISVIVLGAIAIFTVKFWTVMWAIVRLLDEKLSTAMNDDRSIWPELFLTANNGYKRMALAITILTLYIALPTLWTGMMGWAGVRIGSSLNQAKKQALEGGENAGKSGAGFTPGPSAIGRALSGGASIAKNNAGRLGRALSRKR